VANYEAEGAVLQKVRVTENETLRRVTEALARAAKPKYIILFGSQARGEGSEKSDFDVTAHTGPFPIPNSRRAQPMAP
jgi:predicted nucleotidyltransferase